MKNFVSRLMIVASLTSFAQTSHALTIGYPLVAGGTSAVEEMFNDGEYRTFIAGGALFFALIDPTFIIGWLLEEPQSTVSQMTQSMEGHGANPLEAKRLAVLIVNGAQEEAQTGRSVIISAAQVEAAAPNFSKSEGFKQMLKALAKK